jgi:YD repeat-containing protein
MPCRSRSLIILLAVLLCLCGRGFGADASVTVTQTSGVGSSGTVTIRLTDSAGNNYQEIVSYGQFSTPSSIASAFGAKFSNDYIASALCSHAVGVNLYFHLGTSATFATISITPSTPFSLTGWTGTSAPLAWQPPSPIVYGTALSATQLDATSSLQGGSIVYTLQSGTILSVGTVLPAGTYTLTATLTPASPSSDSVTAVTVPFTVNKATPAINWATPAPINDSATLAPGTAPLDATSPVAGSFSYSPNSGSLTPGDHLLTATFTPSDTADYNSTTAAVSITVATGTQVDTGTATLTVNGVAAATYSYGVADTPSTIAEGLAANAGCSPQPCTPVVTLNAADDALYIESIATTPPSNYNYSYALSFTPNGSSPYSTPPFGSSPASGQLDGGQVTGTPSTVYNYSVPTGGYDSAGNLLTYTDATVMGTWNFTYDKLNRLATATAGTNAPAPFTSNYGCWSYDAFGNRTSESMSTTPCTSNPPLASWAKYGANNRFTSTSQSPSGVTYDPAGNLLYDGQNQYLYDGEGRICAVASTPMPGVTAMTGYAYNADGTRVAKGTITAWSCDPTLSGFKTKNDYILGPSGEQITEMGVDATAGGGTSTLVWQHSNVYAGAR